MCEKHDKHHYPAELQAVARAMTNGNTEIAHLLLRQATVTGMLMCLDFLEDERGYTLPRTRVKLMAYYQACKTAAKGMMAARGVEYVVDEPVADDVPW